MRNSVLTQIAILLLVLLIITGCKGGSTFGKFGKSPTTDSNAIRRTVYTGTNGLTFGFLANLPPNEIYDTSNIQIVAEIRNEGTHTIRGADFYLSGYDPNIIQGMDNKKEVSTVEGKTEFLIDGGYENIRFESTDIVLPRGTDQYNPNFILTACYEYQTLANPIVCIDPNKRNPAIQEKGACNEGSEGTGGGQGAPVAVSKVDVDSSVDKVFFRIEVQNSGKGKVIDQAVSRSSRCPFDLDYDNLDEVSYDVTLAGATPTKCSPLVDGMQKIKLANNRATITCEFDIPATNRFAYTTPLQVKLDYGYTESTSPKQVRIYKTGR